jgi:hypothetical protein
MDAAINAGSLGSSLDVESATQGVLIEDEAASLVEASIKTLFHFFPLWSKWLSEFPDSRKQDKITYPRSVLIMATVLLLWLRLSSRRQWTWESKSKVFTENINRIIGCKLEKLPHGDTLVHYLGKVPPERFQCLIHDMVRGLIRKKVLDQFRLYGYVLVAIDATGIHVFRQRHCEHCLVQKKDGKVAFYYHNVLEAKLVCSNGLVISIGTEFIENEDSEVSKQDCELNAFYRLARRIKKAFPQLPICLLLDGLYACAPVFEICKNFRWKYIVTFKEGSMPATWQEFLALKKLSPKNKAREIFDKNTIQTFRWVEGLAHQHHTLNVIECRERNNHTGEATTFVWATNFDLGCKSVVTLSNKGGRLRWKIENEGFNVQKNAGYGLEHTYSTNPKLMKTFYLILQIAHLLHQLVEKGSLLKSITASFGSIKNFVRRLGEQFRYLLVPFAAVDHTLGCPFQIRLDTS